LPLEHPPIQVEIHQGDHVAQFELGHPFGEAVEFACAVSGTDQGANRCPANDVGADTGILQRTNHADMGPPTRRAAAQGEPDYRLTGAGHHGILLVPTAAAAGNGVAAGAQHGYDDRRHEEHTLQLETPAPTGSELANMRT